MPVLPRSPRVLWLDPAGRVLLVASVDPGGGSHRVSPLEASASASAREAHERLGRP